MQIFLGNIKGVVDSVVVLFKALYNAMSIKSKDVHMEVSDCNDNGDISWPSSRLNSHVDK